MSNDNPTPGAGADKTVPKKRLKNAYRKLGEVRPSFKAWVLSGPKGYEEEAQAWLKNKKNDRYK